MPQLPESALDILFRNARTHRVFLPKPVPEELLRQIYELFKLGPTSGNTCPARILFVTTEEGKARLLPALAPGNVAKSKSAPVVAVIAYDLEFYEKLPELSPGSKFRELYVGKPDLILETAFRNGTLQGAYLMLAARAMGLDCGPMSGFDAEKVNAEFFPDGKWKANFVCNLGYGDASKLGPRQPRLSFDDACQVL